MKSFLVICSLFSTASIVCASPPIEARYYVPAVGESCEYQGYSGVVTRTNDCPGGASIWQYGPQAQVQCCVTTPCNARGDPVYGSYTCLNTYKKYECGQGQGKFVPGHCFGDYTIQCCVDGGLDASTGYDEPWYDENWGNPSPGEAVVVPTLPNDDAFVVPTLPDDEAVVVPTIPNDNDATTVPTFERPVVVPTKIDRGRNWGKGSWEYDISSAYGETYAPSGEEGDPYYDGYRSGEDYGFDPYVVHTFTTA